MPTSSYLSVPARDPRATRRRAVSIALTLAVHVLLLLLLLRLTPELRHRPQSDNDLKTFSVAPEASVAKSKASPAKAVATARRASSAASANRPAPVPAERPPTPPVPSVAFPAMIGGGDLFKSADVAKLPNHAEERADSGSAEGDGKDSVAAYGPGEGPGGQRLYNAEWYREPTDAELGGYLPANVAPGSWALIACRTIANYGVENCRSLGESPIGSGLGRAMRLAAWQFKVRPPRLGGKPMVGAWVRIRIDFTEHGVK